jgi:hypothetical protein
MNIKFNLIILLIFLLVISTAYASDNSGQAPVRIDIISANQVSGLTGQFVKIQAKITNSNTKAIGGVAYISILDVINNQPIDLEDWSAEKGIYIPTIAPGQSVTHEWSIRLVKAGNYTIDVIFNTNENLSSPTISSRVFLVVQPKINLNPDNVLPVAFGVPILLVVIFVSVNYWRRNKLKI